MSRPASNPARAARDEAIAWRLKLADGPLDAAERAALDAWRADPANAALLEAAGAAWDAVGERATRPAVVVMRGAAYAELRRASRLTRLRAVLKRRRAWIGAGLAAACVIGVLGVWLATAPRVIATGLGQRQAVVLADGSRVSLDAQSEVRVRYTRGRRALTLEKGRARFSVAHDPLRPFMVAAGDRTVVAVGTDFSVERIDGAVRVILYQGRVAAFAAPKAGAAEPQPVRIGARRAPVDEALAPGEELVLTSTEAVVAPVVLDPGRTLAWEAGQLVFSDEPLGLAVARLNRYAARPLRVADARTAAVRVSGAFTAGDTRGFLEAAAEIHGVSARDEGGAIVLAKAR